MDFSQDPQVIKAKVQKYWKYGLAALSLLVIGPFAGLILNGVLGLFGLMVAAMLCIVFVNFIPYLSMVMGNWKLKAIMAEAAKHPIETMTGVYIRGQQKLEEMDKAIEQFQAGIGDYHGQMDGPSYGEYPPKSRR